MTKETKPPAGWYRHPSRIDTLAYWDGQTWTATTHPAPALTAPRPARMTKPPRSGPALMAIAFLILLAAAALNTLDDEGGWLPLGYAVAVIVGSVGLIAEGVRIGIRAADWDRQQRG